MKVLTDPEGNEGLLSEWHFLLEGFGILCEEVTPIPPHIKAFDLLEETKTPLEQYAENAVFKLQLNKITLPEQLLELRVFFSKAMFGRDQQEWK